VISSLRFPSKLLWLVTAGWALLAARGHKELERRGKAETRSAALVGAIMLGAALCLYAFAPISAADDAQWRATWRFVPWAPLGLGCVLMAMVLGRRSLAVVALVVAIDLLVPGQTYNAYASGDMFRLRPSLVDELYRQKAARIHVFQKSAAAGLTWRVPEGWSEEQAYYFGQAQFLSPPQSARWGIKGSFDGDYSGLAGSGEVLKPGLLRLAGVTHAIRFRGAEPLELPLIASLPTFHTLPVLLLSVPDSLPMAYVVHRVRSEPTLDSAIRSLADPAFDSAHEVVRVQEGGTPRPVTAEPPPPSGTARIEAEEDGRWLIRARLARAGTLVVLMGLSEGWRATVDGRPAPIHPANVLFQSLDLAAGEHAVELEYETPGLRLGFGVSALAWALVAFASVKQSQKEPRLTGAVRQ
jgi:hypothetical protein